MEESKKNLKEIFNMFDREGVNYCVLRNYDNIEASGDIDILVDEKEKLKKLMEKIGYKKGAEYGPYLSYKGDFHFDIKVGCLPYIGFCYKNAAELLKSRRKKNFFFVLGEKDELIHLVLHSIIDKGYFKEEYKKRIVELLEKFGIEDGCSELGGKFGSVGEEILNLVLKEEYERATHFRNVLMARMISASGIKNFFLMNIIKKFGQVKKIVEKTTWMPYKIIEKMNKRNSNHLELDFRMIGIKKKFHFYVYEKDAGLSAQLKFFGFREPLAYRYHNFFITKNDRVLDIGANLGIFAILSRNAEKIVCVEPLKKIIPLLKKNVHENGLGEKTEIINVAVGKESGKVLIEERPNINLSRVSQTVNESTKEVRCISLKDLVKKYKINTLRMDLEGYEYELLYENIPEEVKKISMELHTGILGKKRTKELLLYLRAMGFKIRFLIEDLPLRLYPFFSILKKLDTLRFFTYAKKNIDYKKAWGEIIKGRAQRYLVLER